MNISRELKSNWPKRYALSELATIINKRLIGEGQIAKANSVVVAVSVQSALVRFTWFNSINLINKSTIVKSNRPLNSTKKSVYLYIRMFCILFQQHTFQDRNTSSISLVLFSQQQWTQVVLYSSSILKSGKIKCLILTFELQRRCKIRLTCGQCNLAQHINFFLRLFSSKLSLQ